VNLYRGLLGGHLHASMFVDLAFLLVATALFYWLALKGMHRRLIE
jgi:hypothetical protein